jgi:hypothetical protein
MNPFSWAMVFALVLSVGGNFFLANKADGLEVKLSNLRADHAAQIAEAADRHHRDTIEQIRKYNEAKAAYELQRKQLEAYDSARRDAERRAERAERLRKQAAAEIPAAIERASVDAVRRYAQEASRDIELARAGLEDARRALATTGRETVRASLAAHTLNDYVQSRAQLIELRDNLRKDSP